MSTIGALERRIVDIERPLGPVYGVSWVEYMKSMVVHGALIGALLWLASYAWETSFFWAFYVLVSLAVLTGMILLYMLAHIHSIRIYADRRGVWLRQGVFPWEVQTTGLRWEDAGEASCHGGILPWLIGGYNVFVLNRHTNGAELWCNSVADGHHFSGHINSLIRRYG